MKLFLTIIPLFFMQIVFRFVIIFNIEHLNSKLIKVDIGMNYYMYNNRYLTIC